MLIVHIHNEGTRPDNTADYTYKVYVNQEQIAAGTVYGHNRYRGWRDLLRMIIADEEATTLRAAGYSMKKCPHCGEWVTDSWYSRHRASGCRVGMWSFGGGEHYVQADGGPWHENASGMISAQKKP